MNSEMGFFEFRPKSDGWNTLSSKFDPAADGWRCVRVQEEDAVWFRNSVAAAAARGFRATH